jgi:hypothetical protein
MGIGPQICDTNSIAYEAPVKVCINHLISNLSKELNFTRPASLTVVIVLDQTLVALLDKSLTGFKQQHGTH